jgi:hypothetical protein
MIKRAIFLLVLDLLRGTLPLPRGGTNPTLDRAHSGGTTPKSHPHDPPDRSAEAALALWGAVLKLAVLIEESLAQWDASAGWAQLSTDTTAQPKAKGSLFSRSRQRTVGRPAATSSSSTRSAAASIVASVAAASVAPSVATVVERASSPSGGTSPTTRNGRGTPPPAPPPPSSRAPASFMIDLEAEAAVNRLLGDAGPPPPLATPTSSHEALAPLAAPLETPPSVLDEASSPGRAAPLPSLPDASSHLRRDTRGVWSDAPLAISLLRLIDPLIVQASAAT